MKTIVVPKRSQRGSILLVSLAITFIIGITLASYLVMTQNQNVSVVRSQTWNSAIALSEAGVEDALAMLNRNGGNFDTLPQWTNSSALSADHWESLGANVYHARRYLGSNYYDAYITNLNNNTPSIRSIGTVAWNFSFASAPQSFFAAAGVNSSTPAALTRKIVVQTKADPVFSLAMAAVQTINLNGNNLTTDSFDSADTNYCDPGGLYPANVNKTKDGGDVVTDATIVNALNVGNANIKGVVKTGPLGTISVGPNGSVGDRAWVEGGNHGIKPGRSADDMNVVFNPVTLPTQPTPAAGWSAPFLWQQNVTTNGTTYNYAFSSSGDYKLSSLSGKIYVAPGANVRLYVTGNANFSGQDQIDLSAGGSTLKIYMGGTFSTSGNGAINNYNQNAANFDLFGLPTCTSISLAGNGALTGVIYAPQAALSMSGGGNTTYDFVGATITKSVVMNGHFNFHYDENLRRVGPALGYVPTNWKEAP